MNNKFEKALTATLNDEIAVTTNGACGYATSGKKLLDLNFSVSSLRNKTDAEVEKIFSEAYYENPLFAVKFLFFLRDCISGLGERRSFRICFRWLASIRPEIVIRLLELVKNYGRYDDLFCLISFDSSTALEQAVIGVIDEQFSNDFIAMKDNKPISLLAKWLPSVNTSSEGTVKLARYLAKALNLSEKQYRKALSAMRKHLNVIEQKMSAGKWNEIDYATVPSKANIKYRNAFLRNDGDRRRKYLDALSNGTAKINSAVNFPSDIVHAYSEKAGSYFYGSRRNFSVDPALEAMWKALPDYVKDHDNGSTIVIADGSGSMLSPAGQGSKMTCLDVANSLAIYFAEKLQGQFRNKYITFSEHPQYVDLTNAKSLAEKLDIAYAHNECANTNIEAVFDLLLETATRNGLAQSDIPVNVLIVSDMSFDQGTSWGGQGYNRYISGYSAKRNALFESIKNKWAAAGYKMPRLVFWNVNSSSEAIPLQQNDMGVCLVSGYSVAIANMVFSARLDPYNVLVDALNSERYKAVEDALTDVI